MKKTKNKKRVKSNPECTTCGYPHNPRLTCLKAWLRSSSTLNTYDDEKFIDSTAA